MALRGFSYCRHGLCRLTPPRTTGLFSDAPNGPTVAVASLGRCECRDEPAGLSKSSVACAGSRRPPDQLLLWAGLFGKHLLGVGRRYERRGTLPPSLRVVAR